MPEQEQKRGRGRPKMTEEQRQKKRLESLKAEIESIEGEAPPPPLGDSKKNRGDRWSNEPKSAETNRSIIRNARKGLKHDLVDTYNEFAIMNRFMEFLDECEEDGIVPTVEGLYLWLGMDKSYFNKIINRHESYIRPEQVVETLQRINAAMAAMVSSAADAGSIAPATAIMKLTNCFGYRDVKQVQHVDSSAPRLGSEDDYKKLQERYSVQQIIPDVIDADFVEVDEDGNEIPPTI